MSQKVTASPDFTVRSFNNTSEIDALLLLTIQEFNPGEDSTTRLPRLRGFFQEAPYFDSSQLRGAFLGDTYMGGYIIEERVLCMGPARLLTGCIGGVVTHVAHRNKGIGTALLQDAINYGQARQHSLLLLDGIPNFYHRFGFSDVHDITRHTLSCKHILSLPASPYQVVEATAEDNPTLLELYQRHYGYYTGSFTRSQALQEHLFSWRYRMPPLLALSPDNEPQGYLLLSPWQGLSAYEVAADNWPAALALLQYHARKQAELKPDEIDIRWPLPPNSHTLYLLADAMPVHSQVFHQPNADWMARPAHLPTLIQNLLPLWQDRCQQHFPAWSGIFGLIIDGERYSFETQGAGIWCSDQPADQADQATLSLQVFTQLLFGYRPLTWARQQPGQHIPYELFPILNTLFPSNHAWIAGSDAF